MQRTNNTSWWLVLWVCVGEYLCNEQGRDAAGVGEYLEEAVHNQCFIWYSA